MPDKSCNFASFSFFAILSSLILLAFAGCTAQAQSNDSSNVNSSLQQKSSAVQPKQSQSLGLNNSTSPFPSDITEDSGLNESLEELDALG